MNDIKSLFLATIFSFFWCTFALASQKEVVTNSPDEKIQFTLTLENKQLFYGVFYLDKRIIGKTAISITIDDNVYPGSATIEEVTQTQIDNTIVPTVPTVRDKIAERANETLLSFSNNGALRVRVYNDGFAFRWETKLGDRTVFVNQEQLAVNFAQDFQTYWPEPNGIGFFSHQENDFQLKKLSDVSSSTKKASGPFLFDINDGHYLLISDVNVEEYPGLWFRGNSNSMITAVFPHYPRKNLLYKDRNSVVVLRHEYLAKTSGNRQYPWRAFVLTDAAGLLNSTLLYTLAEPSSVKDTSWIKPGKIAWDWFNDWNLTDVDFTPGVNQLTYKHYIDFAADNNLDYVILDEGWSKPGPENLLAVVPEIGMPELVSYANSKDIGIILWMTSVALAENFHEAFEQFKQWEISGLKVDFMQRDDQQMMDFCAKVAEKSAEYRLLVDFHGGSKPTGLQRTYPNVLTHESVLGLEQTKWSRKANPDLAVLLPFTRMVVGPMDYTPGAMDNFTQEHFRKIYNNPGSLGTRAHQLAMYVAYLSPLQMLADSPSKYRREPVSMQFLSDVPTTWEETVVLTAEVGESFSLARRHGDTWYLTAMTNWQPRSLSLPLAFLGNGDYELTYWSDGDDAETNPQSLKTGNLSVVAASNVEIKLAPGGGYVAKIVAK